MATRLISAGVGLIIMAIVMFADKMILSFAISVISAISVYEGLKAYGYLKSKLFIILGILASSVFAWASYFKCEIALMVAFLIITCYVAYLLKNHSKFSTKDLFTVLFLTLVIPFSFSTLSYIRNMENGAYYVWLPFISAWLTDSFAYFGGYFFGKNKLCPDISPKKTVEGAVFGVVGAVVGYVVYSYMLKGIWNIDVSTLWFVIISVFTSVISQMGDLFASLMKRENGIKDFGNLMPGHGGALDRFDSILLTSPFIFIFLKLMI